MYDFAEITPALHVVAHSWTELPNVWWLFVADDGDWRFLERVGGEDSAGAMANLEELTARLAANAELKFHTGRPPEGMHALVPGRRCADDPRVMIIGMIN